MTFELAAARILAPAIGSSIYVWTSVIGVILAALSAGYSSGGKLADKRVRPLDVSWLLLLSSISVVLTLLNAPFTLSLASAITTDARIQAFFASLILFAPTSYLLGMISPYLTRLKNVTLLSTGTTVASLSAMNAIGGIAGTFITGFIFFAYIGTKETMLLVSVVLYLSSWLILSRTQLRRRMYISVIYVALVIVSLVIPNLAQVVAAIETPTASYIVSEKEYKGEQIIALQTGPAGLQSAVFRDGRKDLVFGYTRKMVEIIATSPQKKNILVLGGGAFTLPQYLADSYPSSTIDVVEIDDRLPEIARQYFTYKDPSNVKIISQDARIFLNSNQKIYDIIVVDVYSDTFVPFSLATTEYTQLLRQRLTADGIVAANVIGADNASCGPLFRALHTSYSNVFPNVVIYPLSTPDIDQLQNFVFVYSAQQQSWLPAGSAEKVALGGKLTDNYAPVEHLKQTCLSGT